MEQQIIKEMANKWPSNIVARTDVRAFSGGVLHPRTMANLDSAGRGPAGRFKIGKKTVYPVDSLIEYLIKMADDRAA
jgi:hypothetical protein